MTKEVNRNVHALFQKLEDIDDRFSRVKVWLMHTGENYNGSFFDRENVEKAIPSLANTPILGFIEDNGEEDFSDHRMILVKEGDEFKTKYLGQAWGLIPETNNAKFEFRVGDDGVEREYLTCEGILWQKWDIPTEIMSRDLVKSQSMELHKDFKGFWNKDSGLFHFTDFKFFGACILGSDVMPAMNSATIELDFTSTFQSQVNDKMEEFKVAFARYQESNLDDTNKNKDKEGEEMHEKLVELLAKYSLSDEVEQVKALVLTDYTTEDELDAKLAQIAQEISVVPAPENEFAQENEALKLDLQASKDSLEQLQADFESLKNEKESIEGQFTALSSEVVELRTFKDAKVKEERKTQEDALYESFASQLSAEEITSVKDASSELSLEEVEIKLFALVGKKNFQAKPLEAPKGNVKVGFTKENTQDDGYGNILTKHLKS